uniref:Putative secreted protein salivary gland overexpressed n=1 Tax=Rhipicephalus microplus TaxID=6941 RepID=A0A6M2DA51_RHIMP
MFCLLFCFFCMHFLFVFISSHKAAEAAFTQGRLNTEVRKEVICDIVFSQRKGPTACSRFSSDSDERQQQTRFVALPRCNGCNHMSAARCHCC